ncbi:MULTISPECIES: hypothetical protein [Streptomyces]|uniref:hypothetical protein n=1 Tax=Streptomyces TaxID=1883 RepID=UPI001675DF7B|nr:MULTISPECIES: hypothetical protein [Streptomyces]MBK3525447.1 hypothetical protein [Streptomyces sp. MBT70]GGS09523.1 hypothetical protein GCM10010236_75070 [Streptomyces eurythermus]
MRTKDVRVGETYRCEVPLALPWRRYRPEKMGDSWLPLSWLRGTYFLLSVVDVDTAARTAHGLVMRASPRITVELTEDQAREAGLPTGGGYQVSGMLLDAEGEPVELPRIGTLTVPLRWLHPVDTPVSLSHHDASVRQIP